MQTIEDVSFLTQEYTNLLNEKESWSSAEIEDTLIDHADWSPQAAQELVYLAKRYGSFVLRNALAVSIAMNIEDGECGL